MIDNPGTFNKKIEIITATKIEDKDGFPQEVIKVVLKTKAAIKTTKGFTLIMNNVADFEKAYTNFTIRFPKVEITRKMFVLFKGKRYRIDYINNVDEDDKVIEIQAIEVSS